jgi:branched-chain amino acid aminotransferase
VFLVLDGRLVTPPLSSGCLAGVTRELVLEICEVAEAPIPFEALAEADEIFVTSSIREVQAVHQLDGRQLHAPGNITRAARDAYLALVDRTRDP